MLLICMVVSVEANRSHYFWNDVPGPFQTSCSESILAEDHSERN